MLGLLFPLSHAKLARVNKQERGKGGNASVVLDPRSPCFDAQSMRLYFFYAVPARPPREAVLLLAEEGSTQINKGKPPSTRTETPTFAKREGVCKSGRLDLLSEHTTFVNPLPCPDAIDL